MGKRDLVITFSKNWVKLNSDKFTTIRVSNWNQKIGYIIEIVTPKKRFYARLYKTERMKIGAIDKQLLEQDFDYISTEKEDNVYDAFCELMTNLNYFYVKTQRKTQKDWVFTKETKVSILYFRKIHLKTLNDFL